MLMLLWGWQCIKQQYAVKQEYENANAFKGLLCINARGTVENYLQNAMNRQGKC